MNIHIHRLLDEAFAGVEQTPEAQDLKEEVRANLVARVDELEGSGRSPENAARTAIAELGDVRALLDPASGHTADTISAAYQRNHVRPKPGFVVRTVVLSLIAAACLVFFVLAALSVIALPLPALFALGAGVAVPLGLVTADALMNETTTNHPMPARRAAGYGSATFGVLGALALGAVFAAHLDITPVVVAAALLLVLSVAGFSWLGATQTNRHKAWVRTAHASYPPNRFEQEPEVAARFGVYTAAIWIVTFAVMVVLIFTAGWWWAPVAFVAGLAAMMLLLGRMMFRA
jgi:hypothetical protein